MHLNLRLVVEQEQKVIRGNPVVAQQLEEKLVVVFMVEQEAQEQE
jgi:hypothetical protein